MDNMKNHTWLMLQHCAWDLQFANKAGQLEDGVCVVSHPIQAFFDSAIKFIRLFQEKDRRNV
jgi:hypothetical protein